MGGNAYAAPVSWIRHEAGTGANPYISRLISSHGMEAYGRYWRLLELLMLEPTHEIGGDGGAAIDLATFGLCFADDGEAAAFLETLARLSLLAKTDGGGYRCAAVDEAAEAIEANRERGRKGGMKAAENRRARAVGAASGNGQKEE